MRGGVAAAPLVSRERERRKLEWACHGDRGGQAEGQRGGRHGLQSDLHSQPTLSGGTIIVNWVQIPAPPTTWAHAVTSREDSVLI